MYFSLLKVKDFYEAPTPICIIVFKSGIGSVDIVTATKFSKLLLFLLCWHFCYFCRVGTIASAVGSVAVSALVDTAVTFSNVHEWQRP